MYTTRAPISAVSTTCKIKRDTFARCLILYVYVYLDEMSSILFSTSELNQFLSLYSVQRMNTSDIC